MTLPPGWAWTTLDNCVEVLDSRRVPINASEREQRIAGKPESALYPYYGATGHVGWIDDYLFDEELVLLGEDGAPFLEPTKNKAYVINGKSWVNNHAHVLKAISGVTLNPFLCHYLNAFDYHEYVTGTTRLKLNQSQMNRIPVPLAPFPEQHRIVAEIEEQFTRLDAGVAALRRVQANLKRYKASVLKAACEGKLVAQDPNDEPASASLERILAERRKKWEEDLRAKGKDPSKAKYVEPTPPDTDGLPTGWISCALSAVAEVRLGRQRSPSRATGPNMRKYLRAANVTWNGLDLSDVKEMDFSPEELETYRLKRDDVVLGEASGSISEVGKPALWKEEIPDCCFQNTLIRVRSEGPLPSFLLIHFQYDAVTQRFSQIARGVGIHHLGAEGLSNWRVRIPPLAEQRRIVAEVERRLSVVQEVEGVIAANLARAERLRQSILKQAFEGKLVPQDVNDEPASVLLERIRAQRAEVGAIRESPVPKSARCARRTSRVERNP